MNLVSFSLRDGGGVWCVNPELITSLDPAGENTIINCMDGKARGVIGDIAATAKKLLEADKDD